ncbi:MAG: hypothetical protein ACI8QZ_000313 [Chlamydiales bacterium]|jgi:hypothetical protein
MLITNLLLAVLAGANLSDVDDPVEFGKLGITWEAPPLEELAAISKVPAEIASSKEYADAFEQRRRHLWTGTLGETQVTVGFHVYHGPESWMNEPGDVSDAAIGEIRARDGAFRDLEITHEYGPYGHAAFVKIVEGEVRAIRDGQPAEVIGTQFVLAGLLELEGYVVHARCVPAPDKAGRRKLLKYLEDCITYDGPERDPMWTLDEVRERWVRDVPEDMHEDFLYKLTRPAYIKKALVRTKHYLILTNSSSGKLFAKKMEENYEEIGELFPFDEVDGMHLMPVFLFRTRDQYNEFYAAIANKSIAAANRSGGHAWRDYYATWYEAPGDPVHIHECTHQIFHNRMGLNGGGSWFQEGVAEYVETVDNQRNIAARFVKKGEHTSLVDFVKLRSLLDSSKSGVKGEDAAGQHYKQAALLIEFLRESKFGRKKFVDFLLALGRVPRSNSVAIEAAFQRVYGMGLAEVDVEWQKYCKKR